MLYYYYTYAKIDTFKKENIPDNYTIIKEPFSSKRKFRELLNTLNKEDTLFIQNISDIGLTLKDILHYLKQIKIVECNVFFIEPNIRTQHDFNILYETIQLLNISDCKLTADIISHNVHLREENKNHNPRLYQPKKFNPNKRFLSIYHVWRQGQLTAKDAAKLLEMSRATFFRYVEIYEKSQIGNMTVKMGGNEQC